MAPVSVYQQHMTALDEINKLRINLRTYNVRRSLIPSILHSKDSDLLQDRQPGPTLS